jgi:hypothetical protein
MPSCYLPKFVVRYYLRVGDSGMGLGVPVYCRVEDQDRQIRQKCQIRRSHCFGFFLYLGVGRGDLLVAELSGWYLVVEQPMLVVDGYVEAAKLPNSDLGVGSSRGVLSMPSSKPSNSPPPYPAHVPQISNLG